MKSKHKIFIFLNRSNIQIMGLMVLILLAVTGPVLGDVVGKEIEYTAGRTKLKGYAVYDNSIQFRRPGIIVVHEWWGHNAYTRRRADMLAKLGYTAFALDMYGEGKLASNPEDAGESAAYIRKNLSVAKERFLAARKILSENFTVDSGKIGAIGYCFGGAVVLDMVRNGVNLRGAAVFHANLSTNYPAVKNADKTRLLVMNGEADKFVNPPRFAEEKREQFLLPFPNDEKIV